MKTYVIKSRLKKEVKEQHWFKLWIKEGYNIRQLSEQSAKGAWLRSQAPFEDIIALIFLKI